jgi:hypothetical protein
MFQHQIALYLPPPKKKREREKVVRLPLKFPEIRFTSFFYCIPLLQQNLDAQVKQVTRINRSRYSLSTKRSFPAPVKVKNKER